MLAQLLWDCGACRQVKLKVLEAVSGMKGSCLVLTVAGFKTWLACWHNCCGTVVHAVRVKCERLSVG